MAGLPIIKLDSILRVADDRIVPLLFLRTTAQPAFDAEYQSGLRERGETAVMRRGFAARCVLILSRILVLELAVIFWLGRKCRSGW